MEWSRRVAPSMAEHSSRRAVRSAVARQHVRTRDHVQTRHRVQTRDARDGRCRRQIRRGSIGRPPRSMRRLKRMRVCPRRRGHRPMRRSTPHVHPSVRSTRPGLLRSPRPMRLRSISLTRVRSTRGVPLRSTRLSRLRNIRAVRFPRTRDIRLRSNTSPIPLPSTRGMRSPSTSLGLPPRPPVTQGRRPQGRRPRARTTGEGSTTGRGSLFRLFRQPVDRIPSPRLSP